MQEEQEKHIPPNPNHAFPNNPIFSSMKFNYGLVKINNDARPTKGITEASLPSWYCVEEEEEESGSCSGVDSDESDDDEEEEEVKLEYELIFNDGKTKRKIEQLAAMVGVDTTDPGIVLSEVVKVLKHLKTINNQY